MVETDKKDKRSGLSLDWLVSGVLSKIGDTVDRVTGRGWNPSSSLATSKLIEKIKFLLDEEVRDLGPEGKFAPHVLTLKMQWNKFDADSEEELEKLKNELHAATIDHINDRLYHTFAPIEINVKTDYFTEGVRLIGSFGEFGESEDEAAVNVTLPNIEIEAIGGGSRVSINLEAKEAVPDTGKIYTAEFEAGGKRFTKTLDFAKSKRFSIGRGKENEISIDDASVSKVHAALVLDESGRLLIADTGSTNGTYIDDIRIQYGKAVELTRDSVLRVGTIGVRIVGQTPTSPPAVEAQTEAFSAFPPEAGAAKTEPAAFAPTPAEASAESGSSKASDLTQEDVASLTETKVAENQATIDGKEDWEI